jgi:predicted transcriptional regulator
VFFYSRKGKKIKDDHDRQVRRALRMQEFGYSNTEIADVMGINEAKVCELVKEEEKAAWGSLILPIERIIVPTLEHKIVLDNVFKNVRSHFERHKVAYSFGAGLAIAGITCAIMKGRIVALAYGGANGLETADTLVTNRPFFSFWSGQKAVVIRNEIGRPSYLIHDINTDLWYRSQNAAAKALGATDKMVSDHVNGLLPHVVGHHLERVLVSM